MIFTYLCWDDTDLTRNIPRKHTPYIILYQHIHVCVILYTLPLQHCTWHNSGNDKCDPNDLGCCTMGLFEFVLSQQHMHMCVMLLLEQTSVRCQTFEHCEGWQVVSGTTHIQQNGQRAAQTIQAREKCWPTSGKEMMTHWTLHLITQKKTERRDIRDDGWCRAVPMYLNRLLNVGWASWSSRLKKTSQTVPTSH